jgi:hypothetical protein
MPKGNDDAKVTPAGSAGRAVACRKTSRVTASTGDSARSEVFAAVTALLFTIARFLIGLYIGKSGVEAKPDDKTAAELPNAVAAPAPAAIPTAPSDAAPTPISDK